MSLISSPLQPQLQTLKLGALSRHAVAVYFLLAYLGSWLVLLTIVLGQQGLGLRTFFSRYIQWRVGLRWYLLALLLHAASNATLSLMRAWVPDFSQQAALTAIAVFWVAALVVIALTRGRLGYTLAEP